MECDKDKVIWRSNITKKDYIIKIEKGQMVILEATNGSSQIFTTKENLKLFYTKLNNLDEKEYI